MNGSSNPSNVAVTGILVPPMGSDGRYQCGGTAVAMRSDYSYEILQGVPAQTKVSVSGIGVISVSNSGSQFKCMKSLSAGAFTLVGHVNDAFGHNTDPCTGSFVWKSDNEFVCTVNQSGVVTPTGRGEAVVECRYSRGCNAPYNTNMGDTHPSTSEATAA